jgi:hypothetical protein
LINREPTEKDLRTYGAVLGLILTVLSILSIRRGGEAYHWLSWCAYICFLSAAVVPNLIQPVFHAWLRLASGIAAINTLIVTAFIFYIFVAPYGVLRRIMGDDPLDLKMNTADSYWHKRDEPRAKTDCERQF